MGKEIARDMESYKELQKLDGYKELVKKIYIHDTALFKKWEKPKDFEKKFASTYIVMTAREWLQNKKQTNYEAALVKFINILFQPAA